MREKMREKIRKKKDTDFRGFEINFYCRFIRVYPRFFGADPCPFS